MRLSDIPSTRIWSSHITCIDEFRQYVGILAFTGCMPSMRSNNLLEVRPKLAWKKSDKILYFSGFYISIIGLFFKLKVSYSTLRRLYVSCNGHKTEVFIRYRGCWLLTKAGGYQVPSQVVRYSLATAVVTVNVGSVLSHDEYYFRSACPSITDTWRVLQPTPWINRRLLQTQVDPEMYRSHTGIHWGLRLQEDSTCVRTVSSRKNNKPLRVNHRWNLTPGKAAAPEDISLLLTTSHSFFHS